MHLKKTTTGQFVLLLLFLFLMTENAAAQSGYFVYFCDKPLLESPENDFDQRALDRRSRHGIPFPMPEDYPVYAPYRAEVAAQVDSMRFSLRWFNAVTVMATEAQIREVRKLPFVAEVRPFTTYAAATCGLEGPETVAKKPDPAKEKKLDTLFRLQRERMHLDTLLKEGLTGKGIRIAVFDAGFKGVTKNPAFEPLRKRQGILDSKDFYSGGKNPLGHSKHGTAVLGCLAGWYKGAPIGAAPDAEYLLARTEFSPREKAKEEDAWMAAAEWADRKGADIISSSLGYTQPLHTYKEMDGRSTVVAKAAQMAIDKGILVVNSAGNEGTGKFHYIGSPADVDQVLTVGACYPMIDYPMPFSSFGPNARQVTKPDISGTGYVVSANKKKGYDLFSGTSFACPLVAGIAACMMQRHPKKSNLEIRKIMVEAGHFYPYYDYVLGHGVLDARNLFRERAKVEPTFSMEMQNDTLFLLFDPEIVGTDTSANRNGTPVFFHFADANGRLKEYRYFRLLPGVKKVGIPPNRRPEGKLRIWFAGYYYEAE